MSARRHPQWPQAILFALLVCLNACGSEPSDTEDHTWCDENPCDPRCADLDLRCSDACQDSSSTSDECTDPHCDPLCDPCDDRCTACKRCTGRLRGPDLPEAQCDAVSIADDVHTNRWEIGWQTEAEHPSWLLSIWGENGAQLAPVTWHPPGEQPVDLETWTEFAAHQQNISPAMITLLTPIAPQFEHLLAPGEHRISVDLEGESAPCWQWTPQQPDDPGKPYVLRIRLVAVGTSYADAEAMRQDPLLRAALDVAQTQFQEAGIELYVREWAIADPDTRALYHEISSAEEARKLLRVLPPPSRTDPVDALTVDIALIDRFTASSMLSGLVGGLPGPVALHGQDSAGAVISTALLPTYRGEEQVGMILTHELGHYLGLRHTSSWPNLGPDPLDDTPECPKELYTTHSDDCPDAYNVMFPLLSMREPHWWSEEQKQVMRWHPAVTQRTP